MVVAVRKLNSPERIDGLLSKLPVIRIRMDEKEVRQVGVQTSEDCKHGKLTEHHEILKNESLVEHKTLNRK